MNHLTKISTFALLAFTLSATSACENTSPSNVELQPPSAGAFASLALDARDNLLQSFTIDADTLDAKERLRDTFLAFDALRRFRDCSAPTIAFGEAVPRRYDTFFFRPV